jgi:hypothetical protein
MSQLGPLGRLAFSALVFVTLARISPHTVHAQDEGSQPPPTPQEARIYQHAPTLIDWTPEQIRAVPELRELQPAESQQDLPAALREVGERVTAFFDDFPNATSTEEVQTGPCSIVREICGVSFEAKFQYLLVGRIVEGARVMTEYRADKKGRPIDYLNSQVDRRHVYAPFLTYGFAVAPLLHFHPQNRMASRFRHFGRQMVAGKETDVVGFAEIPDEYCCPTKLGVGHREVKVFVQGLAWIDAATHQILRIQTFLLAPRPDVGLEGQTTRIEYSAVKLPETSTAFWLPTKVVVDIWLHQGPRRGRYRNIHSYSHYKLFRVESRINPVVEK